QGQTLLGAVTVTADAAGLAPVTFTTSGLTAGGFVTATATDQATGDTSQFSNALKVPADGGLTRAAGYATGSGEGTASAAKLYAADGSVLLSLSPFAGFRGGTRVASGDLNGDGVPDLVVGAGPGGGPAVLVYSGNSTATQLPRLSSFFAFSRTFTGGVFVAAGDLTGDGKAEVIVGMGKGGSQAATFNGLTGAPLQNFAPFGAFPGG